MLVLVVAVGRHPVACRKDMTFVWVPAGGGSGGQGERSASADAHAAAQPPALPEGRWPDSWDGEGRGAEPSP